MKDITGVEVYYYFVCERKLWYYNHHISMEHNSEDVAIGKSIDEKHYMDEEKHITIRDTICIDFIQGENVIHEVKKSKIMEEATIEQIKYYLWYLQDEGVENLKGIVNYPLLRKSKHIELTKEDTEEIKNNLDRIREINQMKQPPQRIRKKICKQCAYFDLCFL